MGRWLGTALVIGSSLPDMSGSGFPNLVGIAPWHVHPIPGGHAIPGDCPLYPSSGMEAGWGPSFYDRQAAKRIGKPMYIQDAQKLWRQEPNGSRQSWNWSNPPNGCTWQ